MRDRFDCRQQHRFFIRTTWSCVTLWLVAFGVGWSSAGLSAQESALPQTKDWLAKKVLAPSQPLNEVQKFCDSRILPLPQVTTSAEWDKLQNQLRQDVLDRIVFRGQAAEWRKQPTQVEYLSTIAGGPGYRIRKLRYEVVPGLWIPALLYEPEKLTGKHPVFMNVNGHDGAGKAAEYKQLRCINMAKRGIINLNVEWLGMGQLRTANFGHYKMNQLDLCGTSGLAPFYLSMSRGLDILLQHEHADPQRVGVAGLSGGGWQTIIISSLDPRVTLANPVAGYSSFKTKINILADLGDSEQTPSDLGTIVDYATLTAMRAPRPTLLTYNAKDQCCFKAETALPPLLAAAEPMFKLYGKAANLRSHVNSDPGTHNFLLDNRQALYRMLGEHFFPDMKDFNPHEIPSADEVKTAEQLLVELPTVNADFASLARDLSQSLPRNASLPPGGATLADWQRSHREKLARVVKSRNYKIAAEPVAEGQASSAATGLLWKLRADQDWTIPAVELAPLTAATGTAGGKSGENPEQIVLLVADAGRAATTDLVHQYRAAGKRVIAVDPFYFGENKIEKLDFLWGLLVAAHGERPLGIQASQLTAVARWVKQRQEQGPRPHVTLAAVGPRSSLFALVAAGLEPAAIDGVELRESYGTLKEVLEQNLGVNQAPELFCFGLLEQTDILQIAALVAPRPLTFVSPSERVQKELSPLKTLYTKTQLQFDSR